MIYIELCEKGRVTQFLSHHCHLFSFPLTLYHCVIVRIFIFPWYSLLPSNREVQNAHGRKKGCEAAMRRPTRAPPASSQALPLGLGVLTSLPLLGPLLLSFHSADCLSLILVQRGKGGSGQAHS